MKILSIETSCEHGSIALLADDAVLEHALHGHANHSAHLLPEVRALLAEAGMVLADLDAVAFGSGPGAFTGLRLACAAAQGLALGAGLGVVPVCSLAALALQGEGERIFAATDARMNEIYFAAFLRTADGLETVLAPHCASAEVLRLPVGEWFALGSAFAAYPELGERFAGRLHGLKGDAVPRAGEVARLAAVEVRRGALVAPELAAPLYVRDKVALTTAERLARGGRA
ncbi:tRNA (adenosine(37)-N6)-threonylcarbamoyltransferase complex dimerization subunit type 1 TsaB [Pseudothauera rhizosphaerae]|uniref:tRNA (Adenosine(37)-N6)-threonylcarbamoyltransferase complex dimerization subunit type 1 TsaB n=1 Tax=Pseudothauera rhizosphaerae TaxID=2565932 RepID=A0A4S4AAG4_9RHOO|nr:tRNA (adenosine(37)-N6)-threonylcarbamoyltransferase complex dimerization subunit type 1 TsaB [Pseudothauera rhizosphaerae]THF55862.1 tRNA (adenosine(37)-N6)-threonylcarbamoyltransferase complex dimerization subunit type 1 TsaB [Pseudothauera rhizosphaerae]